MNALCARTYPCQASWHLTEVNFHPFDKLDGNLTSRRLRERAETDVFLWHSYKATPVFDQTLCVRVGLKPLEFDGRQDSLFHPFDREGRRHMEYLRDRGTFPEVPFEAIRADFKVAYPSLVSQCGLKGDFHAEAIASSD
jgi:hypothetical protein